jgi:hypothetical protein
MEATSKPLRSHFEAAEMEEDLESKNLEHVVRLRAEAKELEDEAAECRIIVEDILEVYPELMDNE